MKRYNAFTIQLTQEGWDSSTFMEFAANNSEECCLYDQPQYGDGIFWFSGKVLKELFAFTGLFNWITGTPRLYINGKPLTKKSHKTKKPKKDKNDKNDEKEKQEYEYLPWEGMTDVEPVTKEKLKKK